MTKNYTMIAVMLATLTYTANGQNRSSASSTNTTHSFSGSIYQKPVGSRAAGDTLLYMPLPGYTINATDAATFTIVTEDNDLLTPSVTGYTMDFDVYYSTDSSLVGGVPTQENFYHPWETPAPAGNDTSYFWSATSWFTPVGQADNWLEFGPITIPAGGATLRWYDRTSSYRDGYEVLVTNSVAPPLSFTDFTSAAIFTETDDASPSATYAVDTTWELKSVAIPAMYNGQQIAIAYHHNANNMDVLRLDEIHLIEGPLGVYEFSNGVKLNQNSPNPVSGTSAIAYELEHNATIAFIVFDVTGKIVVTRYIGEQNAGTHTIQFDSENLAAGVYYYSLTVNNSANSTKKMVIIK